MTSCLAAACVSSGSDGTPSPPGSVSPTTMVAATATASRPTERPAPETGTAVPPPTPTAAVEPRGYPLDPSLQTDLVTGTPGSRVIVTRGGATVGDVSRRLQISGDPESANASGWNCATHVEYEGSPAVDWYVPLGTPVRATMDGTAMLIMNTYVNAFDFYGTNREPYIGDPDRARAAISPFPGPGGGMGIYVSVVNDEYRTDYGHLSIDPTIANVPAGAFAVPYTLTFDYASAFAVPQPTSDGALVATWAVKQGDVIGYTGDAGYSEAPHLHYQITRRSDGAKLCPTAESGFEDAGWLGR